LRHVARDFNFDASIKCEGRRVPKSQLVYPGELERAVEALTRQIGRTRPILVLLDTDDDCPKNLADSLKARCYARHPDLVISIVIAMREYEGWFLAAAKSLAGQRGLDEKLVPPIDPESIAGAKEWLMAHMPPNECYSATRHLGIFGTHGSVRSKGRKIF
jgi:hypothetical protein